MRRVFFGVEIPAEIKERLLQARAEVSGASWQSVEQLHLTLLFLGNIGKERLSLLIHQTKPITKKASGLSFKINIFHKNLIKEGHSPWVKS